MGACVEHVVCVKVVVRPSIEITFINFSGSDVLFRFDQVAEILLPDAHRK